MSYCTKWRKLLRTCNRMIPDENEGGSVLRLETAVISFSVAIAGDVTVDRVLVSTVPSGSLWSASHPFMASEQSRNLCFMPMVCIRSLRIYIYIVKRNKWKKKKNLVRDTRGKLGKWGWRVAVEDRNGVLFCKICAQKIRWTVKRCH